jgi:hypothetical protein
VQVLTRAGISVGITGAVVGMAATPAFAASSLTVSPGSTVTSNGTVSATGSDSGSATAIGQTRTLTLTLTTPDGQSGGSWSSGKVDSTQSATVKGSFATDNAINGTYTFTLKVNSSTADTANVTLRIPPATVAGFNVSASGTVAHFTWSPNSERDLAGYDLVDVTDSPRDLTPGGVGTDVCDANGCAVDVDFGSSAQGTSRSFVIDALRYTSPSHSSTIASADSDRASVTFPAPPPSSSSGSGGQSGSGGSTGGSTPGGSTSGGSSAGTSGGSTSGGTTSGGTTRSGRTGSGSGSGGHGISSNHPSAALKAFLPSVKAGSAPSLPSVVTEVKPLPEGTYKPTLAYPDQVVNQALHKGGAATIASVRNEIVRVLDVGAVWRSLAGAVLVLLVAAHLRAWVSSAEATDL